MPVNCGAIPETILESELFGHRKGAFTGAIVDKKGLLEEADRGGTVPGRDWRHARLDAGAAAAFSAGRGSPAHWGHDDPPGGRQAGSRYAPHLEEEVAEGRFRQDFYYRINVVGVQIPPLRERPEDIVALAEHFLQRIAARFQRQLSGFTPGALELMQAYDWPGNARELENAIERAANLASGPILTEADLPAAITVHPEHVQSATLVRHGPYRSRDEREERTHLMETLEHCRWNQGRAAAALGISRTTLWRKMREHRIQT